MSKLQTYISERKKLFREKFNLGSFEYTSDKSLIAHYNLSDIESFNEETIEGVIKEIIYEYGEMNDGCGCCSYITLKKELEIDLQALNTKE